MLSLQLKSELDPIAILALGISLVSFVFNIIQWKLNGFRLRVSASGDFLAIPDDGFGHKICARVTNVGGKKFQVTHFSFYDKNKPNGVRYMPTNPFPIQPPFAVDIGNVELVYFHQDRLIENIERKNLCCEVNVSHKKRPIKIKVKFPEISK